MEAIIVARGLVSEDGLYPDESSADISAAVIMYYLVKGLSHIEFFWGKVVRYVNLSQKDLMDYVPEKVVRWLQFSSADKGGKDMSHFEGRNTMFTIFSLNGRSIRYFSNCADEEDEVLFMPHSSFLVCDVKYDGTSRKHSIFLRQVPLIKI